MNDAFELERKRIASATSWVVPFRCITATLTIGSSSGTSFVIGVLRNVSKVTDTQFWQDLLNDAWADTVDPDAMFGILEIMSLLTC